jgi:hypothetical protein
MSDKKSNKNAQSNAADALAPTLPRSNNIYADTLPSVPAQSLVTQAQANADVVTSASAGEVRGDKQTAGAVTLTGERIDEDFAREIISRRMAKDNIQLVADHTLSHDNLLVNLDGFDTKRKIGYQYVSHADADVVTDVSPDVEERLAQLSALGIAHVLVVHDYQATDAETLLAKVDEFLARVPQ